MNKWLKLFAVYNESSIPAKTVKTVKSDKMLKNELGDRPFDHFDNFDTHSGSDIEKPITLLNSEEIFGFEERAAIMEYDGDMPRQEAELKALDNVIYMREHKYGR